MFVLLGIIILIASFIIALISLVREQRKNEQSQSALPEESRETIAPEEDQQALMQEAVAKRHEVANRLEEMVRKQEAANVVDEAENLKNRRVDKEIFPWEKPVEEQPNETVGDLTEEVKVEDVSPAETFDDITTSSVDDGRMLTGVIELRRQAKEKKKAA